MLRIALSLVVLLNGPAFAQSTAEKMAYLTGTVIGGASACGIKGDRLVALGRALIGIIREEAGGVAQPASVDQARQAHEAGVESGAKAAANAPSFNCPPVLSTFERLERKCTSPQSKACIEDIRPPN